MVSLTIKMNKKNLFDLHTCMFLSAFSCQFWTFLPPCFCLTFHTFESLLDTLLGTRELK